MLATAFRRTFDSGQTVSGICSSTSRATRSGFSSARMPWSIEHVEQVEGLLDVFRRPLLPGVRDPHEAVRLGEGEQVSEFRRRVAHLGGIESDREDRRVHLQEFVQYRDRF